jgi:hypothetical protein
MPEFDGDDVIGMSLADGDQRVAIVGAIGEPGRKLVADGGELPTVAKRLQRDEKVTLLIRSRRPRSAVFAFVPGETAKRFDVESKVLRRALDPA